MKNKWNKKSFNRAASMDNSINDTTRVVNNISVLNVKKNLHDQLHSSDVFAAVDEYEY